MIAVIVSMFLIGIMVSEYYKGQCRTAAIAQGMAAPDIAIACK
jgi:hypothetical protein